MKLTKFSLLTLFIVFFNLFLFAKNSYSAITFTINSSDFNNNKLIFIGFNSQNPNLNNNITEIKNLIKKNLDTTGLVQILEKNDITEAINIETTPNFDIFQDQNVENILIANFSYDKNEDLELKIRMWDIQDKKQLFGKYYHFSANNYRKVANSISNEIFKAITGEKLGHFNSKIVYVAESGSIRNRIRKISMIDFDGENYRQLTDGSELVLTPSFSKHNNDIYYLRYYQKKPQIFSINSQNLYNRKLGGFKATTFASSPHPFDPNLILLSAIYQGNCDIFELNIEGNFARKLTKSPAIDTTASYSPDAKKIIFSSDREVNQQIYIMNNDGTNIEKISHGSGSYHKPSWSPDGKSIAFTKIKSGQFMIGIMSTNGKNEKILTTGYLVEGAKWSGNGRYLIYSKKKGPYGDDSIPRIYTVDIITGHEYEIPTPQKQGAIDPDWKIDS